MKKKEKNRIDVFAIIGRCLAVVVLSVVMLVGIFFAAYGSWYLFHYKAMVTNGKTITVPTTIRATGKCADGRANYDINFNYVVDGETYSDVVGASCLSSFAEDQPQTIPIRYLPSAPDVYRIEKPFSSQYLDSYMPNFAILAPVFFGLYFAMIALVGFYSLLPGPKPWWLLVRPEFKGTPWRRVFMHGLFYKYKFTRKQSLTFFLVVLPLMFIIPGLLTTVIALTSGAFTF